MLSFAQKNEAAVIGAAGTVMEQAWYISLEMCANANKDAFPLLARFMVPEVYPFCSSFVFQHHQRHRHSGIAASGGRDGYSPGNLSRPEVTPYVTGLVV